MKNKVSFIWLRPTTISSILLKNSQRKLFHLFCWSILPCVTYLWTNFTSVPLHLWSRKTNPQLLELRVLIGKEFQRPFKSSRILKRNPRSSFMVKTKETKIPCLSSTVTKKHRAWKHFLSWQLYIYNARVIKASQKIPNVHKLYGHTKGEVDLVDLIFTNSTCLWSTKDGQ